MALSDPVPSSAIDVYRENARDVDVIVNSDDLTVETRTGKVIKTEAGRQADAEQAISDNAIEAQNQILIATKEAVANAGYSPVFTFTDGGTITTFNEVVQYDADNGDWYKWGGTLPKVVTPASTPTPIGADSWTNIGDASLRSELPNLRAQAGSSTTLNTTTLIAKTTNDGVLTDADLLYMSANNITIKTAVHNSTSKAGGADYAIKTKAQADSDGDDYTTGGSTYGYAYLLSGGAYVAVLTERDVVTIEEMGGYNANSDNSVAIQQALDKYNVVTGSADYYYATDLETTKQSQKLKGINIKQLADVTTDLMTISASRVTVIDCDFDGNQDEYAASQDCRALVVNASKVNLINTKAHDATNEGLSITDQAHYGKAIGCGFDDNAGLGLLTKASVGWEFSNTSFDRNGYGFQNTKATNAFIGFGTALRFRTHDYTFTACTANDNGRDGFNVNQGTYKVVFTTCEASVNDDGGFTLAADSTEPAVPGDGEGCYEIDYIGCVAENNYTAGLAAYQSMHSITVTGGRFFNNCRVLGTQPIATSYLNGIFFAGGSTGINIDTFVYDDRQECPITSTDGAGTLAATGWVTGTKDFYPRVAIHEQDGTFRGYGNIVSESAGNVVISSSAHDGVVLGDILTTDRITQKVQSNGILFDAACTGNVKVKGFGFRKGANVGDGVKVFSSHFAAGQNIIIDDEDVTSPNLIANPSFDTDLADWSISTPGGGSSARVTTTTRSTGSLELIAGTSDAEADAGQITDSIKFFSGQFVKFSAWVYCTAQDAATMRLFVKNGASYFETDVVHKGQGWQYMRIGAFAGVDELICRFVVDAGVTAYIDEVGLYVISESHMQEPLTPTRS